MSIPDGADLRLGGFRLVHRIEGVGALAVLTVDEQRREASFEESVEKWDFGGLEHEVWIVRAPEHCEIVQEDGE